MRLSLQHVVECLNRQGRTALIGCGLTAVVLVGALNLQAGYEISSYLFSLLPVSVVTLVLGASGGVIRVVGLFPLGYPTEEGKGGPPRKPLEEIAFHDMWKV